MKKFYNLGQGSTLFASSAVFTSVTLSVKTLKRNTLIAVIILYMNNIENTLLVSFDIKFIRPDQGQRRNCQACRASPMYFWLSLINFISKDTWF